MQLHMITMSAVDNTGTTALELVLVFKAFSVTAVRHLKDQRLIVCMGGEEFAAERG